AGWFGQNCIYERRQTCGAWSRNIPSYSATHRGDLADAEGCGSMVSSRLSWDVSRSSSEHLRTPPSRLFVGCRRKIAMRERGERKAHVSGAVLPLRPNKTG